MNNILPENISFSFYKRGNCHKQNYHKHLPAAATVYHVTMTTIRNERYIFLVSRIFFPLTQALYYLIQGDLLWCVFQSQFFPFIKDKGSCLCLGRETGTVPLSDLCPQPQPPSYQWQIPAPEDQALSQLRNVSFPSPPPVLPVIHATF